MNARVALARVIRFEVASKRGAGGRLWLLAAAFALAALAAWANASYGRDLENSSLHPETGLQANIEALREAQARKPTQQRDYLIRFSEDQLVSDRFDWWRGTVPGSVEAVLGVASSWGAPLLAGLIAALLVGVDIRRHRLYYPAAWGPGRLEAVLGKLAVVPLAATVIVVVLGVFAGVGGSIANWWHRDAPWFGWNLPGVAGRLALLAIVAVAIVSVWGIVVTALALAMRSTITALAIVVPVYAADVLVSTRFLPGARPFLLTVRFAQLGTAFWPPPAHNPVETVGASWAINMGSMRPPPSELAGAAVLLGVIVVVTAIAIACVVRWDLTWGGS